MNKTFEQTIDEIYVWVDEQVQDASPRCEISGRCCRFREYGHRLYISRVEAERLLQVPLPQPAERPALTLEAIREQCPYQVQGRCSARNQRPLGCRIFFCDPTFEQQASEITEAAIQQLKQAHEKFHVPWEYQELGQFLVNLVSETLPRNFPSRVDSNSSQ